MSQEYTIRALCAAAATMMVPSVWGQSMSNLTPFPNASGMLATYSTRNQPIDLSGPFFQALG
ncbi:MAG TPA: hypothetical protein VGF59_28730, partial [Bryobacteraceae bacterium]